MSDADKNEKSFRLGERVIPCCATVDLVVAGGGAAGFGAALAAARQGMKTVIIEREFALGGIMTLGLMSKIAISPMLQGIPRELITRLAESKMSLPAGGTEVPIDPEATKLLLEEMLLAEHVRIMLGNAVVGAVQQDGKLRAVLIENKSGCQAVAGKVFIDATGDGDLAARAGAQFQSGRPEDGLCSAPTLMFRVYNIDLEKTMAYLDTHPEEMNPSYSQYPPTPAALREHYYAPAQKYCHFATFERLIDKVASERRFSDWEIRVLKQRGIIFLNQPNPNQVLVNTTRIPYFHGADAQELSDAMIEGRKQAHFIHRFMKEYIPGFENSAIMDTASILGVRESRRITGDYTFTEDDVNGQARFADAIVRKSGGIEVHGLAGFGTEIKELPREAWYDIPYRSIIAKDFVNLLLAGRCFSATQKALSAARSIGFCMALGEAAGTAAALAIHEGVAVRRIAIADLQRLLKRNFEQ